MSLLLAACSLRSLDGLDRCADQAASPACPDGRAGSSSNGGRGGEASNGGSGGGGGGSSAAAGASSSGMGGGDSAAAGSGGTAEGGTTAEPTSGGEGGSPLVEPSNLVLLYADHSPEGDDPKKSNSVRLVLVLENQGDDSVPLSELSIRYFYTLEAPSTQTFLCDYVHPAAVVNDCKAVHGSFGTLPATAAKNYVEVTFDPPNGAAWSLTPRGGQSGVLQLRFYNGSFAAQDQTNDYSFDPTKVDTPVPWDHVALYRSGKLVFGVEPE